MLVKLQAHKILQSDTATAMDSVSLVTRRKFNAAKPLRIFKEL